MRAPKTGPVSHVASATRFAIAARELERAAWHRSASRLRVAILSGLPEEAILQEAHALAAHQLRIGSVTDNALFHLKASL